MISIIIPAYNAARTLEACVDSIVSSAGSSGSYELIIVNDGSTDSTVSVCSELCRRHRCIRYFEQENGGVSSARNRGIEEATGDFICFVDADDTVSPDYLELIGRYAPEADITFFGFVRHDIASGRRTEELPCPSTPLQGRRQIEFAVGHLLGGDRVNFFGFTWSKVFKNKIIKDYNLRFDTRLDIKEDEIFTLDYCRYITSIQVLDRALYHYNIFGSSLSHSRTAIRYDILADAYMRHADVCSDALLKDRLIDLSTSYSLGHIRELKHTLGSKLQALEEIKEHILPQLTQGHGLKSARWMPWIEKFLPPRFKALAIYICLR